MIFDDMPRKYLLLQSRDDINSLSHIERLPGNVQGAFVSLTAELEKLVKYEMKKSTNCSKLDIKFSGDGTKVSRTSNFIIFSMSAVSDDQKLSYNELFTVGIVKCEEKYENLAATCQPIFHELCNLTQTKTICVNGSTIDLDYFVGGDMKFLQIILGQNGSTSNYACQWCKVHKDFRYDTSKDWDYYHSDDMFRSVKEIQQSASTVKQFGVKHHPFLNIAIDHYIPDELHLMMRIMDILIRNLIFDAKDCDDKKRTQKTCDPIDNLITLVETVQNCGVCFSVWTPKGSTELEWTTLSGGDKIKILTFLPEKLKTVNFLNADTKNIVIDLWEQFFHIYKFINSSECTISGVDMFFKTKKFVDTFLSISSRRGYKKSNVTPYIHCLIYHVPYFLTKYGSLKKFSGQAVEKNNDVIKSIHQRKSNK